MKLIVALLCCVSFAYSQSNDSQLAYQYYQNGEYEKAIEIYQELSKGNSFSQYYHPYFQSLFLSEKLLEAKKLSIKMIKRNANHLPYQVDLYMIYRKINEDKNATRILKKIQEKLKIIFKSQTNYLLLIQLKMIIKLDILRQS